MTPKRDGSRAPAQRANRNSAYGRRAAATPPKKTATAVSKGSEPSALASKDVAAEERAPITPQSERPTEPSRRDIRTRRQRSAAPAQRGALAALDAAFSGGTVATAALLLINRNGGERLVEAVSQWREALPQIGPNLVVADLGSTDGSLETAAQLSVRVEVIEGGLQQPAATLTRLMSLVDVQSVLVVDLHAAVTPLGSELLDAVSGDTCPLAVAGGEVPGMFALNAKAAASSLKPTYATLWAWVEAEQLSTARVGVCDLPRRRGSFVASLCGAKSRRRDRAQAMALGLARWALKRVT